jgi:hypothetical protein
MTARIGITALLCALACCACAEEVTKPAPAATNEQAANLDRLTKIMAECDTLTHDVDVVASQRNLSALFAVLLTGLCIWMLAKKKRVDAEKESSAHHAAVRSGTVANITIRDAATQEIKSSGVVQTRRVIKRNTARYERAGERGGSTSDEAPPP